MQNVEKITCQFVQSPGIQRQIQIDHQRSSLLVEKLKDVDVMMLRAFCMQGIPLQKGGVDCCLYTLKFVDCWDGTLLTSKISTVILIKCIITYKFKIISLVVINLMWDRKLKIGI